MTSQINSSNVTPAVLPVPTQAATEQEEQARNLYILFEGFRESFSKLDDPEDVADCLHVFDPFIATLKEKGALEKTEAMRAWITTNVPLPRNRILSHLTTIDLSKKGLTHLPTEIVQLYALRRLNLTDNSLTTLPEELLRLKKLYSLSLENNPLKRVPDALIHADSSVIRQNSEIRKIKLARQQFGSNPVLNNGAWTTIVQFMPHPSLLAQVSKAWRGAASSLLFPTMLSQYVQDPFLAALMRQIPSESPSPTRIRALYERVIAGVKREEGFTRKYCGVPRLCQSPYPAEFPLSLADMKQRATWAASQKAKTLTYFFTGCVIPKLPAGAPRDAATKIETDLKNGLKDRPESHWRLKIAGGKEADLVYIEAEKSIRNWMEQDASRIACSQIEEVSFYFRMIGSDVKPLWLLEELSYFPGIKKLDASRLDGLSVIPEYIFNRTMLTELDLSYTGLETLSPSIGRLVNLKRLWLNNTSVRTLPVELNQLTQLTTFTVEHLEAVPEELQDSPIEKIRNNTKIRNARTIPRAPPLEWVPEATLMEKPRAIMQAPEAIAIKQKPVTAIPVEKQPEEPASIFQQLLSCCSLVFEMIYRALSELLAVLRINT